MSENGFEFVVRSVDPDGTVPGSFSNNLPSGAEFFDNGNGTRTFRWTANDSQVGAHRILFVTVDSVDPSLRHSQEVSIQIERANTGAASGSNSAPWFEALDNQVVVAGNSLDLRIVPIDPEGVVPGLLARGLPDGSEFVDNYDGTRSLRWTPRDDQTGEHRVVFVAIDATDENLRSEVELLIVVNSRSNGQPQVPTPQAEQPAGQTDSGNRAPFFENLGNQRVSLGDTLSLSSPPETLTDRCRVCSPTDCPPIHS